MDESDPLWRRVGENLVQRRGGTIYLRAKIQGAKGPVKISLETKDLRIAKIIRDERLEALRTAAAQSQATTKAGNTLADALSMVEARTVHRPNLKASSSHYNQKLVDVLRETLPTDLHPKRWDERMARAWWKTIDQRFGHVRANALLHLVRKVIAQAISEGLIRTDPTADFALIRGKKKLREMPSRENLKRVIAEISKSPKKTSAESGLFLEFLAASGLRPAEARAVKLTDISRDWLKITGNETGTKNLEERELPISPVLADILKRTLDLKPKNTEAPRTKLFSIHTPRLGLRAACKRLNLPHLTLYDMRHYFITWAIESGVDVPTIAKWIGHKDGGALLMRTYTHIRDQHSLAKAALLK